MDNLFSVSNIAWDRHDDPAVFRLLSKYGVNGIEIAPSKIWNDLGTVSPDDAKEYRSLLADHGFSSNEYPALRVALIWMSAPSAASFFLR